MAEQSCDRLRVLVTGASGLLGRAINHELQLHKDRYDSLGLCFSRQLSGLTKCDITSLDDTLRIVQQFKPNFVVHCAAERRPDMVERDPERAKMLNDEATERLCQLAEQNGAGLLYISTDYVFDGTRPPYAEDAEPSPLNAYGASKLAGERAVLRRPRNLVLRVPELYGDITDVAESPVAQLFLVVKGKVPAALDDSCRRYPTHCADVALVVRDIIEASVSQKLAGVLHWTSGECFTKYQMALAIAAAFGLDSEHIKAELVPAGGSDMRPADARLSCARLEAIGCKQRRAFADGVRQCFGKYL